MKTNQFICFNSSALIKTCYFCNGKGPFAETFTRDPNCLFYKYIGELAIQGDYESPIFILQVYTHHECLMNFWKSKKGFPIDTNSDWKETEIIA